MSFLKGSLRYLQTETLVWLSLPARSTASPVVADDTHHSSSSKSDGEQSDTRTEHSDEDAVEKTVKRAASVKAVKKPATAKTEVHTCLNTHTHTHTHTENPHTYAWC